MSGAGSGIWCARLQSWYVEREYLGLGDGFTKSLSIRIASTNLDLCDSRLRSDKIRSLLVQDHGVSRIEFARCLPRGSFKTIHVGCQDQNLH